MNQTYTSTFHNEVHPVCTVPQEIKEISNTEIPSQYLSIVSENTHNKSVSKPDLDPEDIVIHASPLYDNDPFETY